MARVRLTNALLDRLETGATARDDIVPGVMARRGAAGVSLLYTYRNRQGVERRPKLGNWPALSLDAARDLARQWAAEVAAGKDPSVEKAGERVAPTIRDLERRYFELHGPKKKEKSLIDDRANFKRIVARLGDRTVASIEAEDVAQIHAAMKATPYAANRTKALLSKALKLAEVWRWRPVGSNPCALVSGYRERKRRRVPTPAEAAAIGDALRYLQPFYPEHVSAILLLILTGARKREILDAEAEWIKPDGLHLPDSKTGEKVVRIPALAHGILASLPTAGRLFSINDTDGIWRAAKRRAGCPDIRIHDMRRLFASAGLGANLTLDQIGQLLGHTQQATTRGYAWLQSDPAQKAVDVAAGAVAGLLGMRPE